MTYQETLNWLFVQLPMYQRQGAAAYKKDLSNTLKLAKKLGNPENTFQSIHVAGTNGKGSTSHMLASVFQETGLKVGLYTSPHLKDFRERIKINGQNISKKYVVDFVEAHKLFFEENSLSFFEMTVGLAFQYFSDEKIDIAIVEVGLGGRLDSTNILAPILSVITNIGLDHTQFLGTTLEAIAAEKGGVVKEKTPVVIGEHHVKTFPVFQEIAHEKKAPLYLASKQNKQSYPSDLKGSYQIHNIKTVQTVVEVLRDSGVSITEEALKKGLLKVVENTGLLGRWQELGTAPKIVCDTAHNKEGLTYTLQQITTEKYQKLHIVLGMVNDKDFSEILSLFPKEANYYFCAPNLGRALEVEDLQKQAKKIGLQGRGFATVNQAYKEAKMNASKEDFIYIGGSTFVVAEILE
jgi:dihydrofolate synthase / folylpolyglutamate synthase